MTGPSVVDFRLSYQPTAWFRLQVGRFKVPFSSEFLIPDADTDLNHRARVVGWLAPGRSVGAEVGGRLLGGVLFYRLGMFNGNGSLRNDDGRFLFVGRLGMELSLGHERSLVIAGNAATSNDTAARLPLADDPFSGQRRLLGLDARLTLDRIFLATEGLYGRFVPEIAGQFQTAFHIYGWHLTSGYLLLPELQVLLRWEYLARNDTGTRSHMLVPSLAYVVPDLPPVQLQLDVELPPHDLSQGRLLASATIAF